MIWWKYSLHFLEKGSGLSFYWYIFSQKDSGDRMWGRNDTSNGSFYSQYVFVFLARACPCSCQSSVMCVDHTVFLYRVPRGCGCKYFHVMACWAGLSHPVLQVTLFFDLVKCDKRVTPANFMRYLFLTILPPAFILSSITPQYTELKYIELN